MRKIAILACLLFAASQADAAITLVQHRSVIYSNVGAGIPETLAFSSNTTAGNFIVASCGIFDNRGGAVPIMYDALGNHFSNITFAADAVTFSHSLAGFANYVGGPTTIKCLSANATFYGIIIAEYSGVDTRYPVDVWNGAYSGAGGTKSAGAITTTQAIEAICTFYYDDHIGLGIGAVTPPTGFTKEEEIAGSNTQTGFADQIVSSIQTSFNPSWSNGSWAGDGVTVLIVSLHSAFSSASGITLNGAATNNTGTTSTRAVTNSSGDTLLVGCLASQAGVGTLSIGDSQTNVFTPLGTQNNGSNTAAAWWTVANVPAGADTVTCTSTLSGSAFNLVVVNYHGLAVAALDQHATAFLAAGGSIATPAQTAAITTTSAKEIVALLQFTSGSSTAINNVGTGDYGERFFNSGITVTNFDAYFNDQYFTSIGTYQPYTYGITQGAYFQLLVSFVQQPLTSRKIRSQVIKGKKKDNHAQILTAAL